VSNHYEVIVVGLGAMGSAALFHIAKRGRRVLGLEQFDIPHQRGSSHGITRIIRLAYYEDPSYIPLLIRAFELWRELEERSGSRLLHVTGSIDAGPRDSAVFEGSRRSCELHGIRHEVLDSRALSARFPGYRLPPQTMAVFQPDGGFLLPEQCICSHVMLAQEQGAEAHTREAVLDWEPLGERVRVRTGRGEYVADRLILTAGAWIGKLAAPLRGHAVPERQVLAWFQPHRPELFTPVRFPVFNLGVEEGRYYGLPVYAVPGFKVGRYRHRNEVVDPDAWDRECGPKDEALLRSFAERYFPDGAGALMSMQSCMFTNTVDGHFVLDFHPDLPQVILASPCSGHGFKFASVIGEVLADLATSGQTRYNVALHRLERLSAPSEKTL
jgi:sarcosine oxidase